MCLSIFRDKFIRRHASKKIAKYSGVRVQHTKRLVATEM